MCLSKVSSQWFSFLKTVKQINKFISLVLIDILYFWKLNIIFQSKLNKIVNLITNSSNPWIITKNVTLIVLGCCLPVQCVNTSDLLVLSVSSPNVITFGFVMHMLTEIYEESYLILILQKWIFSNRKKVLTLCPFQPF